MRLADLFALKESAIDVLGERRVWHEASGAFLDVQLTIHTSTMNNKQKGWADIEFLLDARFEYTADNNRRIWPYHDLEMYR